MRKGKYVVSIYVICNMRIETNGAEMFSKKFRKSAKLLLHYFRPRSRTRPNSAIETPIFSFHVLTVEHPFLSRSYKFKRGLAPWFN